MSGEKLVPTLRFNESNNSISETFKTFKNEKLGKYIDIISGYAFKSSDFTDYGIPVIKIKNVNPPNVDLTDVDYVYEEFLNEKEKYIVEKGDILITLTGSHVYQFASAVGLVGKAKFEGKALLNQRIGKIIVKNPNLTNLNYLYYILSTDRIHYKLASNSTGSVNQANINPKLIKNLKISIPPLEFQNTIAELMQLIDYKIELFENKMNNYKDFKKYLMQQIFTQKLRFDFKDEWKIVQLKDIAFVPKKTKLTNIDGLKLLTVKLHTKGIEINDKIKPKLTKRGRPYYIREYGELLIGRQNFHNGGMGIVPKSLDGGICSNAISSFRAFEDKIDIRVCPINNFF